MVMAVTFVDGVLTFFLKPEGDTNVRKREPAESRYVTFLEERYCAVCCVLCCVLWGEEDGRR